MSQLKQVGASLEVAFGDGELPERLAAFRGRAVRAIGNVPEFPFEDSQFDVVLMNGCAVSRNTVREAHRVLRPEGCLYFIVNEKTKNRDGFTLPDIYSIVREGYNIKTVERPPWWLFGWTGRTIFICAQKKNWRAHTNTYRPYV